MDWQPIESAPKDGREIFVSDGEDVATSAWINARWCASVGGETVWEGSSERGGLMDTAFEPTHWMPLPEPPVATKEKADWTPEGFERPESGEVEG